MKVEHKLIALSVALALSVLVVDSVSDSTISSQQRSIPYRTADGYIQRIFARVFTVTSFALFGMLAATVISRQRRVQEDLCRSEEQLRSLAAYLQELRERERTRIAREVHDQLGQTLTALKMELSWLRKQLAREPGPLTESLESLSDLVDDAVNSVQTVCAELRPCILDDFGLAAAIEWQTQEFRRRTEIATDIHVNPDVVAGKDVSTAVFRIHQETLTNVVRHAAATKLIVILERRRNTGVLQVSDNGKGIPPAALHDPKSFGLVGMRERAHCFGGTIDICGNPGRGTTVTVRFPVEGDVEEPIHGRAPVLHPVEAHAVHGDEA